MEPGSLPCACFLSCEQMYMPYIVYVCKAAIYIVKVEVEVSL